METPLLPLQVELRNMANASRAEQSQRYFKTGPGEYGEGDLFIGLTMPQQRTLAKKYVRSPLSELSTLVNSLWHEERMIGFLILLFKYQKSKTEESQVPLIDFLITHRKQLNHWDLVDVIIPGTLGDWLIKKTDQQQLLFKWIFSKNLWERRIAMLATAPLIKQGEFTQTLSLCEIQLNLKAPIHDLMQKASGWMLREIGKKNRACLEQFLDLWATQMPRTMLRYAIEKLPESQRQMYLSRK